MSDLIEFVGRVGQHRSEQNDDRSQVLLKEINGDTCLVRKISCIESTSVYSVPKCELDIPSYEFPGKYPDAPIVKGNLLIGELPKNTIFDLRDADALNSKYTILEPITILSSCRIIGNPFSQCQIPAMLKFKKVIINVEHEDEVVEFVNINFVSNGPYSQILCRRGRISFISCTFNTENNPHTEYMVIGSEENEESNAPLSVLLESCTFVLNKAACGILAIGGCITLINSSIHHCGVGICVRKNARVVAQHCKFANCVHGVIVTNHGQAELHFCLICAALTDGRNKKSVVARNGSNLLMNGCKIEYVGGVEIEGAKVRTTALLRRCSITPHMQGTDTAGVRILPGKVDVELDLMQIAECTLGVCIHYGAIGSVILQNSIATGCRIAMANFSGDKCWIRENGRLHAHGDQMKRATTLFRLLLSWDMQVLEPLSSYERRLTITMGDSKCWHCNLMETSGRRLRMCGACVYAQYCSKACQRQDWKKHSEYCHVMTNRLRKTQAEGYIACVVCQAVEVQNVVEPSRTYGMCFGCCDVFYCSTSCSSAFQTVHARTCKGI